MSATPSRVFVARLAGLPVFDPLGDQVGRVRDVVLLPRGERTPRAVGLVTEVPGRRRIFVPMTRVTSMDAGQVITTGLLNMRRFEQRSAEVLALTDLIERSVTLTRVPAGADAAAVVEDVALEHQRTGDWELTRVFVRQGGGTGLRRRRGTTQVVAWPDVRGLFGSQPEQGAAMLAATMDEMKAPDVADALHEMSTKRRVEVSAELDDERLADVLQELPSDDQVEILLALGRDRAADVLEAMEPDDAADLLGELSEDQQEHLLDLMEPEDARDVRRLLAYDDDTAGGLMTTEPVVLPPEATVAQALATVRREELPTTLAAAVFVCRPPMETPTGRLLGVVHLQRLLREPPHEAIGGLIDSDVEALHVDDGLGAVTRRLATYNLVSLPVTDAQGRLLGAVTVDDVLDHILPEDWREADDTEERAGARRVRDAAASPRAKGVAQDG